jgi:ribosome assembly protein RRB1
MPQQSNIVASWSDIGEVNLWDLAPLMKALDGPSKIPSISPLYTSKHKQEGFAMDWSPVSEGRLVVGDFAKNIYLWEPSEGGRWAIDQTPFIGHQHFVEDLQWSPTESTVFASCSSDRTVKVWDTRNKRACALSFEANPTTDVNVISWNKKVGYLMVSGADDGSFSIWDFRYIQQQGKPAAHFKWHTTPVSTVEWHSEEESVLAVGTTDQITLWDLALEKDEENEKINDGEVTVPAQLLFVHQGLNDVKELHWHPQIPGLLLSTAANGFHTFKTINA